MKGAELDDAALDAPHPTRLLWLNLALGVFLWLLLLTDYSLLGTAPDVVLPFVVLGVALVARWRHRGEEWRAGRRLLWPSLVGGGCYAGCLLLLVVPPFTLGAMFALAEFSDERVVERTPSPDGWREAEVRFRPVGAYAGGNGRTFVSVRSWWLPGLERDVYVDSKSYALFPDGGVDVERYVTWVDTDTIRVNEPDSTTTVDLGLCGGELPFFLGIPWALLSRKGR